MSHKRKNPMVSPGLHHVSFRGSVLTTSLEALAFENSRVVQQHYYLLEARNWRPRVSISSRMEQTHPVTEWQNSDRGVFSAYAYEW